MQRMRRNGHVSRAHVHPQSAFLWPANTPVEDGLMNVERIAPSPVTVGFVAVALFFGWTGLAYAANVPTLPAAADRAVDYAKDVKPILDQHCAKCHGPDKQKGRLRLDQHGALLRGGVSGEPAVVPGKSADSHIIQLVAGFEPDRIMPKDADPLTAEQIGVLRAWVDQGVKMPGSDKELGPQKLTTDHWSFQPIGNVAPPQSDNAWAANPIDAFVLAKLNDKGLTPAPPADRRTLVRRVYLDMLGLLPTPEQAAAFVDDERPDAYVRLVDSVLASPHYGERWARHWLDVVRFAESNGFETNYERPNAYRYRDYVIAAFNDDKPYNAFVFEQLAGDSVGADAATGFLVGGATDTVRSPDPVLTAMQRQDELADMINTTGTSFLGLTLGCAKCHNHKFDPITQRDYYSIQAVFAGVRHGERPMQTPDTLENEQKAKALDRRVAELNAKLRVFEPTPYTGQTVFLDDESAGAAQVLATKRGHGINPAGKQRGYKDDPGDRDRLPNVSGGRYTWWDNKPGVDMMAYTPRAAGRFRVWLSWGCGWQTHTTDAQYLIDDDGDLATKQDQHAIATVNQQLFGDGSGKPVSTPLWSGFHDAGVYDFTINSRIVLRGGSKGEAITADVVVLQQVVDDAETAAPPRQPRLRPPVDAKINEERFNPVAAKFVRFTAFATNSGLEPCLDELEVWSTGANVANVALASAGAKPTSSGNYAGNPKHKLEHINDGQYSNDRSWISNENGKGWVQIELAQPTEIDRITWGRDRTLRYTDRLATRYVIEVAAEPNQWVVVADSNSRMPLGTDTNALAYRLSNLSAKQAAEAERLLNELNGVEKTRADLRKKPMAYAGQFVQPPATHRLYRGDPMSPREQVAPDALEVIGSLGLKIDTPEQQRRVALANWITSKDNPLTPRVMVNRLWQYHFGRGIVATPSDFGAMGFKPTHPQLLDWLAAEFVRSGWSVKHMQRLILMSNTYRQTSRPNPQGLAADAQTTLLWRYPPHRLEAEAIRDNILLVSGSLDLTMGGPSFLLYEPNANYARNWIPKDTFGPADMRRMVYAMKIRMEHDAVFGAFDDPDAGQVCPKRSRSTTPIQALNLFNSGFVIEQCGRLAERVQREAGATPEAQATRLFELAFGRAPDSEEITGAVDLIRQHGLPALCRAVYNANEFLFIP
ncbi:MAG: DUF1553 domain-containing protein [Phycisphaera sp.]|nr:DUF1553 domain-containing protein [Phycisphaera sp.]